MFLRLLKIINWFLTRQESVPIVDEATSRKIIMMETEEIVAYVREWAIDRVGDIHEEVSKFQHDDGELDDAYSLYQEFAEWIEPKNEDLEVVSLDEISQDQYDDFVDYSDGIERA